LKKEYVIIEISAAPDGGPHVLIAFTEPRDFKSNSQPKFAPTVISSSMDDLMKNLQKAFSGIPKQMAGGMNTVVKMDVREYEESGFKVGDKVYLEITKAEKEGV